MNTYFLNLIQLQYLLIHTGGIQLFKWNVIFILKLSDAKLNYHSIDIPIVIGICRQRLRFL